MQWLPTLYKKNSTNDLQEWMIGVDGATIITRWGQIGGAIQETKDIIASGKNLGRANATTVEEQALAEATSHWENKLKKGYVKTKKDALSGKTDALIEGGIFPMLAHKFDEHADKLVYPCYLQPKLDGHRCIAMIDEKGKCTLWSRTRKPITSMKHIIEAIERLGLHSTIFDGELYRHEYKDQFEVLTGFIRRQEFSPGAEAIQYHIYDMPSSWGFEQRWKFLTSHLKLSLIVPLDVAKYNFNNRLPPAVIPVTTQRVDDEDELMMEFQHYIDAGYEGAMARNMEGPYISLPPPKRSYDLLKIKEFDDGEFKILRVEEGRGKLAGHAIFICQTENGNEFGAKLKGNQDDLKQYFDNPKLAVGRYLTVKYQGLTNKSRVPRFPVAMRFREDV